jgi:LmbE family N-acetylglucosaminyl deacetylase
VIPVLDLLLRKPGRRPLSVLCLGAHCDDIEIGCGATLLVLRRSGARVHAAVLSGNAERRRETVAAMRRLLGPGSAGSFHAGDFPDGRFPQQYGAIKDFFELLKRRVPNVDVIFTHERDDRHQDHRIVNEMTWNTWRDQLVLEYEIPKWDGGLGQPNIYVPVSLAIARRKISTLLKSYKSQLGRDWFTESSFMAMLRLRGLECRSESGLAEAFHGRKITVSG